jgi:hypothetical protein
MVLKNQENMNNQKNIDRNYHGTSNLFQSYMVNIAPAHIILVQDKFISRKQRVIGLTAAYMRGIVEDTVENFLHDVDNAFVTYSHGHSLRIPRYPTYLNGRQEDMNTIAHACILDKALTCGLDGMQQFAELLDGFFANTHDLPISEVRYRVHLQREVRAGRLLQFGQSLPNSRKQ